MNLLDAITTLLDALRAVRQRRAATHVGECHQCQRPGCVSESQCPFAEANGDAKNCNCCPACRQGCHRNA